MNEKTDAAWRAWWAARTPETRARMRADHGRALQLRTGQLTEDVDGLPLGVEATYERCDFLLPACLLEEDGNHA